MVRIDSKLLFYSIVGILNLAVGVTFHTLYAPRPEPAPIVTVKPVITEAVPVKPAPKIAIVGIPTRIVVPSLGIDLTVATGSYNPSDSTWTLDSERAFYADLSVPANDNNGNTLIYGHAQLGLFRRLPEVGEGAEAIVSTDTGNTFYYRFESKREVVPTDTSIFQIEGPPKLVLQTCSGPWDAYRMLAIFTFERVESV